MIPDFFRETPTAVKSMNSSGHKRSRLPVVQGKSAIPTYNQCNSFGNTAATNDFKNIPNGQNQLFTRRNLFQPQFAPSWAANPASEDGEVDSQGQESVRKFCTEDTPVSLSKAGSNTNLSSLTFDDDDQSTTGQNRHDSQATGECICNQCFHF